MKLSVFFLTIIIVINEYDFRTVSGYQERYGSITKNQDSKTIHVSANSLNSGDTLANKNKYIKNTYKNVIKRHVLEVQGYGLVTKFQGSKTEYVLANSINSGDTITNAKKYNKNTHKNAIKRHVAQIETDDTGFEEGEKLPTTTEQSYPGYHGSSNIMVIPPRNAPRKNRAIENYGTANEIKTPDIKIRNDTFGENAYENLLVSLYLRQLLGNLKQTENYDLYHYYNKPDTFREEIIIPAAKIDQCREDNSSFCLQGHLAICTKDNTVHCVVEADSTVDCSSKYSEQYCAETQVPCTGGEDPSCTETFLVPCLHKVSVDMRMIGVNLRYCGVTFSVKKMQNSKNDYNKGSANELGF